MATLDKPLVEGSSSPKVGLTTTTVTSSPPPPPLPPRVETLIPLKGGVNKLTRSYPARAAAGTTATSATSSLAGNIQTYTLSEELKRHPIVLRGINQGPANLYPVNTNLTQTKSPLLQGATTTTTTTTSKAGLGTFISEASTLGEVRAEVTTASYDVASAAQTTVMYVQLPGPILRVEMPTPVIRFDAATQQVRDVTIAIPYLEKILKTCKPDFH